MTALVWGLVAYGAFMTLLFLVTADRVRDYEELNQ